MVQSKHYAKELSCDPSNACNSAFQMTPLPEGWTLSEKAGDSKVTLTREFGDEIVQVDFTARQLVRPIPSAPPMAVQQS